MIRPPELELGANDLPYSVPIHPQFVHLTLGLFIIAVLFDIAGALFFLERPIFKFLGLTALRSGFFTVGWYNLFAASIVTFFTVAAGFFEILLATPPPGKSAWGLSSSTTMLLHGVEGVLILAAIVAMTFWRGLQRYRWRKDARREVQWSYLFVGVVMLGVLFVHGTLGAQLGDEFGIHNT
ncbi:MAG: hypothetical protein C4287_00650, partial [Leptolyngbya sp. ERB_1_2]